MNKENYLRRIEAKSSSDHTVSNYRTALNHLDDCLENNDIEFEDLDENNVVLIYDYFMNSNLAGSTIDQYMNVIRKIIRENISEEAAEEISEYKYDTKSVTEQAYSDQTPILRIPEYKDLLDNAHDTRSELIISVLWETGVRPVEFSKIELKDIDRENRTITINTAKIPADSDRPRTRTVHYSIEIESVMREWLDYGGRDKYKTAARSEYLLVTENSTQIDPNYINTVVGRIAENAGIREEYSQEDSRQNQYFPNARHFRNSYATHRSWNGMDLETLRQLMGHHSVEVTSRYVKADTDKQASKNEQFRPRTYSDPKKEILRQME